MIRSFIGGDTSVPHNYHDVTLCRRISDLHGESSEFTDLRNMTNVKKL